MQDNYYYDLYNKGERSKLENEAFTLLVTDLITKNATGDSKQRSIVSHNMEQFAQTNFLPTMFYIFMYARPAKEKIGSIEFYDACPLLLCTSVDEKTVTGINFNYIPNDIRARFLDVLTGCYKDFYENVENNDSDGLELNNSLGKTITYEGGINGLFAYMKEKAKIDLSLCLRKYDRRFIIKTRMLEYDQWMYIPFLTFKDSVRGASLAKVQADAITRSI